MAWVIYRGMANTPEGLHRHSKFGLLFDATKDGGALDIREQRTLERLLASGYYAIDLSHYGVAWDAEGRERAPSPPSVSAPVATPTAPTPKANKKR